VPMNKQPSAYGQFHTPGNDFGLKEGTESPKRSNTPVNPFQNVASFPVCKFCGKQNHTELNCFRHPSRIGQRPLMQREDKKSPLAAAKTSENSTQDNALNMTERIAGNVKVSPRTTTQKSVWRVWANSEVNMVDSREEKIQMNEERGNDIQMDYYSMTENIDELQEEATRISERPSRLYIDVVINEVAVRGMIDSGAQITLIGKELYLEKFADHYPITSEGRNCYGFDGVQKAPILGSFATKITVGDQSCPIVIHVIPTLDIDVILSNHLIQDLKMDILASKKEIWIGECSIPVFIRQQEVVPITEFVVGRITGDVRILPWQSKFVPVKLDGFRGPKEGETVVIEPNERFSNKQSVMIPCSANIVEKGGIIHVNVGNLSDRTITLKDSEPIVNEIDGKVGEIIVTEEEAEEAHKEYHSRREFKSHGERLDDKRTTYEAVRQEDLKYFNQQLDGFLQKESKPELPPNVSIDNANLSDKEKLRLSLMLSRYTEIFNKEETDFGRTDRATHQIHLKNEEPIQQRPHRVAFTQRKEIDKQVDLMLKADVIRESKGPYAHPVVMVKKSDGGWRFCVDYRKLNEVTIKDTFPLPRIDETLAVLHGAALFTNLDLIAGYWQIALEENVKAKTAFICHRGLFEYNVMPMGLCNAPATFQRMMQLILSGLILETCLCYLDDVIIFSRTPEDHIYDIHRVCERLKEAGLKIKGSKCAFAQTKISFLGHIVTANGVKADPSKIEKVQNAAIPKNVTEVKSFLGLSGFYRHFIEGYATLAAPLYEQTNKRCREEKKIAWTEKEQKSFNDLKTALTTSPVLGYPDINKEFILYTDASNVGMGYILAQLNEQGVEHVINFGSRKLRDAETRYSITEKELLAVVSAIKQYRVYLLGNFFEIITDHSALVQILDKKRALDHMKLDRICRMASAVMEYDYKITHKPGKLHLNADALSRPPIIHLDTNDDLIDFEASGGEETDQDLPPGPRVMTVTEEECAIRELTNIEHFVEEISGGDNTTYLNIGAPWNKNQLQEAQAADSRIGKFMEFIRTSRPTIDTTETERKWFISHEHQFVIFDNIMYKMKRKLNPPRGEPVEFQLFVPAELTWILMEQYHSTKFGGHLSCEKVVMKLQNKFYWYNMWNEVREFIDQCIPCNRFKAGPNRRDELRPIKALCPAFMLGVDVIGPLPQRTTKGNLYIVCFMDYFTKYPFAFPTKDQTAKTILECYEKVICQMGVPRVILSDQGPAFVSEEYKDTLSKMGTKPITTTPYHQQANGLVERWNQTLKNMLKSAMEVCPESWDDYVEPACFAYRTSVHPSTGQTPFAMIQGRDPKLPMDNNLHHVDILTTPEGYVPRLMEKLQGMWKQASAQIELAQAAYKAQFDKKAKKRTFSVGDLVLRRRLEKQSKNAFNKFHPEFDRLYRVRKVKGPDIFVNRISDVNTPSQWYNITLFKHFGGDPEDYKNYEMKLRSIRADQIDSAEGEGECAICHRPDCDEYHGPEKVSWIQCDKCELWYHFYCLGIAAEPEDTLWYCPNCRQPFEQPEEESEDEERLVINLEVEGEAPPVPEVVVKTKRTPDKELDWVKTEFFKLKGSMVEFNIKSPEYAFLSNLYLCKIRMLGKEFHSVEQAYQYCKANVARDEERMHTILHCGRPMEALLLGRTVKGRNVSFSQQWKKMKLIIMYHIVTQKFRQDPHLWNKLQATVFRPLVENTSNQFWGHKDGKGLNKMGLVLQHVRAEIKLPHYFTNGREGGSLEEFLENYEFPDDIAEPSEEVQGRKDGDAKPE
jgi:ribA/ribD-fused uncharacterized protein